MIKKVKLEARQMFGNGEETFWINTLTYTYKDATSSSGSLKHFAAMVRDIGNRKKEGLGKNT